jgi:hypothetical protein
MLSYGFIYTIFTPFRHIDVIDCHIVEIAGHSAAFCAYDLFLLLPKLSRMGSASSVQHVDVARDRGRQDSTHKTRRSA